MAAGQPVPQGLRRHVHELDLARGPDDRIGHTLPRRGAGDLRHHVGQGIQVADTDGGDHVDSRRQQVLDVLPSRAMARAGRVAVREIVDQRHRGAAGQHRAEVHLLGQRAPVGDFGGGHDLKTGQEAFGVRPAVRFRARHHHVGAVLRAPAALAEQRAGGAGPGCVAQVDPQPPTGGRSPRPGVSTHGAPRPAPGPTAPGEMPAARSLRTRRSCGVRGDRRATGGAGARGRLRPGRPRPRAGRCPSAAATAPGTGPVPGSRRRRRSRPLPRGGPGLARD